MTLCRCQTHKFLSALQISVAIYGIYCLCVFLLPFPLRHPPPRFVALTSLYIHDKVSSVVRLLAILVLGFLPSVLLVGSYAYPILVFLSILQRLCPSPFGFFTSSFILKESRHVKSVLESCYS